MSELVKCVECGGNILISSDGKRGKCEYCDQEYFYKEEKDSALVMAMNIATEYLKKCDFDNAIVHYEAILKKHPKDSEAAWGLVLSKYGIEYVRDDRFGKMIPTCHRYVEESIFNSKAYLTAIGECAKEQRAIYEKKAAAIDKLQKKIKCAMEDEEDFDVFISFKSKDERGAVTEDSVIARSIYEELEKLGIKTFFSEVTLNDRIGEDYEPIIFRALYSCKFFILVATKEEYINSVWVKNEWTRFRDRVQDESLSGACTAVFKNISPYNLPVVFRNQGVELEKHPFDYSKLIADNLAGKLGSGVKKKAAAAKKPKKAKPVDDKGSFEINDGYLYEYKGKSKCIVIPNGVEEISYDAFSNCQSIASIVIPKSVESIEDSVFKECFVTGEIINRSSLEITKGSEDHGGIAYHALDVHTGKSRIIERGDFLFYKHQGENYLVGYTGEDTHLTLPSDLDGEKYVIQDGVFKGCRTLKSVVIPSGVTRIGKHAFDSCILLNEVTMAEGVTTIEECAFYNCRSLEVIKIPEGVTTILRYAFGKCDLLNTVYIPASIKTIVCFASPISSESSSKNIYYPKGEISWRKVTKRGGLSKAQVHFFYGDPLCTIKNIIQYLAKKIMKKRWDRY